jgi:hypothetical protein
MRKEQWKKERERAREEGKGKTSEPLRGSSGKHHESTMKAS